MKLQWFAMPRSNATPMLFFLFPKTMSRREENGKKPNLYFLLYNVTESATKMLMQEKIQ